MAQATQNEDLLASLEGVTTSGGNFPAIAPLDEGVYQALITAVAFAPNVESEYAGQKKITDKIMVFLTTPEPLRGEDGALLEDEDGKIRGNYSFFMDMACIVSNGKNPSNLVKHFGHLVQEGMNARQVMESLLGNQVTCITEHKTRSKNGKEQVLSNIKAISKAQRGATIDEEALLPQIPAWVAKLYPEAIVTTTFNGVGRLKDYLPADGAKDATEGARTNKTKAAVQVD